MPFAKLSGQRVANKLPGVLSGESALPRDPRGATLGVDWGIPYRSATMTSPQPYAPDPSKGVMIVDWPLFGELARARAAAVLIASWLPSPKKVAPGFPGATSQ